jgi:hypothetical protein
MPGVGDLSGLPGVGTGGGGTGTLGAGTGTTAMPMMPTLGMPTAGQRGSSSTGLPDMFGPRTGTAGASPQGPTSASIGAPKLPSLDPKLSALGGTAGVGGGLGRSGLGSPDVPEGIGPAKVPGVPRLGGTTEALPGPSKFSSSLKPTPLQDEFAGLLRSDPKVTGLTASTGIGSAGAGLSGRAAAAEAAAVRAAASEAGAVGAVGRLAGTTGAAGAAGGMGMPYMPPMAGAGAGQRQGGGERERTTWLLEDDDVWGVEGTDCDGGVIGRPPQR